MTKVGYVYYEPIKNKLYVACSFTGETPKQIIERTERKRQLYTIWYLKDPKARFYYVGNL